jgi:hypothetical protein
MTIGLQQDQRRHPTGEAAGTTGDGVIGVTVEQEANSTGEGQQKLLVSYRVTARPVGAIPQERQKQKPLVMGDRVTAGPGALPEQGKTTGQGEGYIQRQGSRELWL